MVDKIELGKGLIDRSWELGERERRSRRKGCGSLAWARLGWEQKGGFS